MAYIGSTPTSQTFTSGTDYFSGNGSTTAYTLSRQVSSINDVIVVIENVVQKPLDAYTIVGNTLTFTSAPPSGTNNIYVRYMSTATIAIQPNDLSVTTNKIADNVVTIEKLHTAVLQPVNISDKVNTSTGYLDLPAGTTAQRPSSPGSGMLRYNTDTLTVEMHDGSSWRTIKGLFTATGGTVTTVGAYKYHVFTSSGTLTTSGSIDAEYLIIAGGGGGGRDHGGGGGAGGVVSGVTTLTTGTYSAIIGAGGASGYTGDDSTNGSNSSFGALTVAIGGGKGNYSAQPGTSGGSGGGAGGNNSTSASGGSGTAGQGFAGGNNNTSAGSEAGGGGGGAGGAGATPTSGSNTGGAGGIGTNAFSAWGAATNTGDNVGGTRYYAGGGGGGTNSGGTGGPGGAGGGGKGGGPTSGEANPGAVNTGGGAGGVGNGNALSRVYGGSGIIIIRYLI